MSALAGERSTRRFEHSWKKFGIAEPEWKLSGDRDGFTHPQLMDEAIALDDKARADYARWEAAKNAIDVAIGGKADMAYCSANVRL